MSNLVPLVRTCTEISDRDYSESQPLKAFRGASAYVLLGDPGAGKTTVFEDESEAMGGALYISARKFRKLSVESHPEWRGKTLFIDGLDEVRVGKTDVLTPFDEIWSKLDELGKPRFRLSCREADWLGDNDREHLASVAPDGAVTVLRLDPLTDADIIKILNAQPQVDDAHKFVEEAQKRGVVGLLTNPQTLELLVQAVAGGDWPESRLDTFERACRQMVRESNKTHKAAIRGVKFPSADQILNVAGRLCAVQLIADINGYTPDPDESDRDYPSLEECGGGIEPDVYRAALTSYLFKAESDDTRLVPIHRLIAEFLGARHLVQLIADGLPIQRVLALITGSDGGVVTAMRGLSAWLAAQCQSARRELIERDPIGVGLYGDLHQFSHDEKRALLNALRHMGERLGSDLASRHWTAAFGPLVTADMEPVLREILTDPAQDKQPQMWTLFVLRILKEGPPLPELSTPLLDMARDNTRSPRVKALALETFLHTCPAGQDKTDRLKQLLADIQAGGGADPEDELIGTLLTRLYPQDLPGSEVWDYLSESDDPNRFWSRDLLEQSSDEDVAELLNRLLCPPPGVQRALETPRAYLENLVLKLLARGLQADGDNITTKRLYDWLGVGIQYNDHEASRDVRAWLEQRPEIQKKIVVEGFQRAAQSPSGNPNGEISWVRRHLYGANPPSNFGLWCGAQAKKATDLQIVEYFIRSAEQARLSLEDQREQASDHPALQSLISEMIDRSKAKEQEYRSQEQKYQREKRGYTEERKRQEDEWLAYVRRNEVALRENRAATDLLCKLSKAYFRNFFSNAQGGPEAVEKELQGDQSLTQAALQGLRDTPDRSDVPELEAILSLREKGRMSYLEWPFLVGLAEIERTAPEDAAQWDNGRIRKALAFYYCVPHGDYRPKWYRRLLEARPEVVADVQVRFAVSEFRSDSESYLQALGTRPRPRTRPGRPVREPAAAPCLSNTL